MPSIITFSNTIALWGGGVNLYVLRYHIDRDRNLFVGGYIIYYTLSSNDIQVLVRRTPCLVQRESQGSWCSRSTTSSRRFRRPAMTWSTESPWLTWRYNGNKSICLLFIVIQSAIHKGFINEFYSAMHVAKMCVAGLVMIIMWFVEQFVLKIFSTILTHFSH